MAHVWHALAAGSDSRRRTGARAARVAAPVLLSVGVAAVFGATLLPPVAPSGANQVASLQQQAAELSQEMLLEQLQIGADLQQRTAATQAVGADNAELASLQAQMAQTRQKISSDEANLRHAAVKAYVDGGTQADTTVALFASDPSNGASSVYDQVVVGDLSTGIDRLDTDRVTLGDEQASEEKVAGAAQQELGQANAELVAAQTTEARLTQQRDGVTGQLALAVSEEQATAVPSPVHDAPASGGALPALNSFLSCVIQAESHGDFSAVSPTGLYMGAFQFAQGTWNEAARLAGIPSLAGLPPYEASPRDQCLLAIALYDADGEQPWYDPCHS